MANAIETFKKYIDLLDEVYQNASLTSDLDGDTTLVQAGANTNEIVIPKLSMDGLADYDRNSGYKQGNVTLTYLCRGSCRQRQNGNGCHQLYD